ncbi:DNA-dependent metalloprotease SPRTN-like [Pelobates fuscus]|uniref:DNA-dependent metalloprotease SPRTN-like n=1 Tax=Pelobates fuscus TaxID=191477 RepID=UPI002FE48372
MELQRKTEKTALTQREKIAKKTAFRLGIPDSKAVVDPRWESIDPYPDIKTLFSKFNIMFFWGVLDGTEVKWSKRMTRCSGLCRYKQSNDTCSIHLSEPLLKFKSRKDVVETLLHEMIHALLFLTGQNERESHGPIFIEHMERINKITGANISICHDFYNEIEMCRMHWWRCDGPCDHVIKRSMNRAPSARESWWGQHQQTCGGSFIKVREPPGYKNRKIKKRDREELDGDVGQSSKKSRN